MLHSMVQWRATCSEDHNTSIVLKLPLRLCPGQAIGNVCEIRLGFDNGERFAVDLVDRVASVIICSWSDGWAHPGYIKRGIVIDVGCVLDGRVCSLVVVIDEL